MAAQAYLKSKPPTLILTTEGIPPKKINKEIKDPYNENVILTPMSRPTATTVRILTHVFPFRTCPSVRPERGSLPQLETVRLRQLRDNFGTRSSPVFSRWVRGTRDWAERVYIPTLGYSAQQKGWESVGVNQSRSERARLRLRVRSQD